MGVLVPLDALAKPPLARPPASHVPGARVLNLGCGDDTYGTHRVDFAPGASVTEVASVLSLPFRDGTFDEVFAANILEHMGNPRQFLEEAVRVLRPGGRLVLVTDHAAYLGYHFVGTRPGDNHQWHGVHGDRHFMLFSEGHLRNLCESVGLQVERVELFTKWRQGLAARLVALVARPLTMANIRIEAVRPAPGEGPASKP